MLRKFSIICACFYLSAHAQQLNSKAIDTTENRHHYTLDVMRVVQGTMQFGREFYINKHNSLKASVLITWAKSKGLAKPYLKAQNFQYYDNKTDTTWNLIDTELKGAGLNLHWREYYTRGQTDKMQNRIGAYAGPEMFFRFCQVEAYGTFQDSAMKTNNINPVRYMQNGEEAPIYRNLFLGFVGYSAGYQKALFNDNLLLDLYVSGGFFFSKYDDEDTFTQRRRSPMVDYTGPYLNVGIGLGYQF